jgi:hypothetical protein
MSHSRRFQSARSTLRWLVLALILSVSLLPRGSGQVKRPRYHIEGTWSDACPCHISCPCWRTQKAQARRCLNVQVFHIEKGYFEGSELAGATLVMIGMPSDEYGTPDLYRAYSDRSVGAPITPLFETTFGLQLARGTETVSSIKVKIDPSMHSVTIPGLLSYVVAGEAVRPTAEVEPYLYPWIRDARQWRTRHVRYTLSGDEVMYSGTNALEGRFRISSAESE